MTEQKKEKLWNAIQKMKNPDIKYQKEFEFLLKHGKIISVSSLEEGLTSIKK